MTKYILQVWLMNAWKLEDQSDYVATLKSSADNYNSRLACRIMDENGDIITRRSATGTWEN